MKQINDLNLASLSAGLSKVLSEELGGEFSITVQKFERTGSSWLNDGVVLNFAVTDESGFARHAASKEGQRYSGLFDTRMTAETFRKATVRTATDAEVTYDVRPLGDDQQAGMAAFLGDLAARNRDRTLSIAKPILFIVDDKFQNTDELSCFIDELREAGLVIQIKQPDTTRQETASDQV